MIRLFLMLLLGVALVAEVPYRIVFVHLGDHLPPYLRTAISQAHLFNPQAEIILIANQKTARPLKLPYLTVVPAEKIPKTKEHQTFIRRSRLDRQFRDGFWFYATERLFYLDDLISHNDWKNTFHLENDNMLYADLSEILPVFIQNYPGIGAPFESDERGLASFIFVAGRTSIHTLASYFLEKVSSKENEMVLINGCKEKFGLEVIDHLPTLMEGYAKDHPLVNRLGQANRIDPGSYSKHSEEFGSLFDACSYGQYHGGIDPRNGPDGPGYLNEQSFFNCSYMQFEWQIDARGRKVPYAIYSGKKYRINNLHIHSKDLDAFASLQ